MPEELRVMQLSDHESVKDLCALLWGERDYVPRRFPHWIEDSDSYPFGIFSGSDLLAMGCLEVVPDSRVAWAKALRVSPEQQRRGHGSRILHEMVETAKIQGVTRIRYATSSRNKASIALAERSGFSLRNSVGYYRLEPPFPQHPKPSPSIAPLSVGPDHLAEVLDSKPFLIGGETFPFSWEFYGTDAGSLERIAQLGKIRVINDDSGEANSVLLSREMVRDEVKTSVYSFFSINRSVFVDTFSRVLDELEESKTDRAAFFFGPGPDDWVQYIVDIPEEFKGRRFLLFEYSMQMAQ
ncbi:MAG: GNAT family N-acetyltransferase [Candidatus Thorarchaeota archaeon]